MSEAKYTTRHVLKALDLTLIRLRGWEPFDCLKPSIPSPGQGKKAYYSKEDIYKIALFKQLVEKGMKRELVAKYLRQDMPLQFLQFLAFETVVFADGRTEVRARFFSGGNVLLEIKPDGIDQRLVPFEKSIEGFSPLPEEPESNEEEVEKPHYWKDFFVVNFAVVMHQIDNALKKME